MAVPAMRRAGVPPVIRVADVPSARRAGVSPARNGRRYLAKTTTEQYLSLDAQNGIPMKCQCCGQSELEVFFTLPSVPVFCNVLWDSPQAAKDAPRGQIRLAHCPSCGYIRNTAFDPCLTRYAPTYENSLHYSPHFQQYARALARRLVREHNLRDNDIVEIGCGRGDFLAMLCDAGPNRGIGFDPSFDPRKLSPATARMGVTILPEPFSPKHASTPMDFLCCRHVLEHIDQPLEFLKQVRLAIGDHAGLPAYFEVPDASYIFAGPGLWDVIYEHCSYFSKASLQRLFAEAGFAPMSAGTDYDGQFLWIQARAQEDASQPSATARAITDSATATTVPASAVPAPIGFAAAVQARKTFWFDKLRSLQATGKRLLVWGGGSKGVTWLNALGVTPDLIPDVVDLNPSKQGKFVPGTCQRIVSPGSLSQLWEYVIIVMNPVYMGEIADTTTSLGLRVQLIAA
jgi:SAM-dependent methyltransferase